MATSELPPADRGLSYTAALEASGGQAPYEWEIEGLPNGVESTGAGLLQGMPLAEGTNQLQVTVSDATGATATAALALEVVDAGVPEECVGQECLILDDPGEGTVELSAAAASQITVDDRQVTVAFTDPPDRLPPVGGHLVVEAVEVTDPLLVVAVTSVTQVGADTLVVGTAAGLADAFGEVVIHAFLGDSNDPAAGLATTATSAQHNPPGLLECETESGSKVTAEVELDLSNSTAYAYTTGLIRQQLQGAGVGINAVLRAEFDATLEERLTCETNLPQLRYPVFTVKGITGYLEVEPVVEFDANAQLSANLTTAHMCHADVTYTTTRGLQDSFSCGPLNNQLTVDPFEAEATLAAGLDLGLNIEGLIGLTGEIRPGITGRFTPDAQPVASLDLHATAALGGCLGCRFDNAIEAEFIRVNWVPTTIWETPTPPPTYTPDPAPGGGSGPVTGDLPWEPPSPQQFPPPEPGLQIDGYQVGSSQTSPAVPLPDGGAVVTMTIYDDGPWLARYDAAGAARWMWYETDEVSAAFVYGDPQYDDQGNVYVTVGWDAPSEDGEHGFWLLRIGELGTIDWIVELDGLLPTAGPESYFIVGDGRVYAITDGREYIMIDQQTGARLASAPTGSRHTRFLGADDDGLISRSPGGSGQAHITYLDHDLGERATHGVSTSNRWQAVGASGEVFVVDRELSGSNCIGYRIHKVTPAGVQWTWEAEVDGNRCYLQTPMQATADGGLALVTDADSLPRLRYGDRHVTKLSADGQIEWVSSDLAADRVVTTLDLALHRSGDLLVSATGRYECPWTTSPNTSRADRCWDTALHRIVPTTGNRETVAYSWPGTDSASTIGFEMRSVYAGDSDMIYLRGGISSDGADPRTYAVVGLFDPW